MSYPKVSIIIPIYGVADYISVCLDSVIAQDYNNIEVLLINDCTPDDSMLIAKQIIAMYKGPIDFKIIDHQTNQKIAAARNTGIRNASGEFLFFLDSDDKLSPYAISALVNEAVDSDSDVTTANRKAIDWETGEKYKMLEGDYPHLRVKHIDQAKNIQVHGTVWNKLIKRDFILKNKLYFEEGIVYEDDLWMFKLYCCRPSFSCITDVTYTYYIRHSSIMQTYSEYHLLSRIIVAQRAIAYLPQVNSEMLAYAYWSAENFRQGALASCLAHVKDFASYGRIYEYLRQYNIDYKTYMSSKYLTLTAKLRFLGSIMPLSIGKWWNFLFIKIMLWKGHHNYIYLTNDKINLGTSFWNKLRENDIGR